MRKVVPISPPTTTPPSTKSRFVTGIWKPDAGTLSVAEDVVEVGALGVDVDAAAEDVGVVVV